MADYFVNEGNKIGAMPAEFGANSGITLVEKKITASAAVTKGQIVEVSGDMTVAPTSAASDKVVGVAMFDAAVDTPVVIHTNGLFKLVAGGAITAGDAVESGADGKIVSGSTKKVLGIALNTASANDAVYVRFNA
jgi:hypothetical protein